MSKKLLFLVDDNIMYLNAGKVALQDEYSVITIPSGEKLLETLPKLQPDLILLDIEMPDKSGYEVLQEIKANPATKDIPVIFLTAKSEMESELYGLSLGAVDYITKPFSQPLLRKRVELHLIMKAQRNELQDFNNNLQEMVHKRTEEITNLQSAVIMWAAEVIEFRDEETGHHVERVQKYLKALLDAMKESERYALEVQSWDKEAFLRSSVLHDIGKIRIKDNILLKPGRLTPEERADMQLHVRFGDMLLDRLQARVPSQAFLDYAKILALRHHERWDGKGYPDQLREEEIPLQARMMAIADVYDALISERPYKKAFTHEEAMKIIREGGGSQFDPHLTELFWQISATIYAISATAETRG
ncbi:MAG: response regulator [Symbiobacteriaceae bacterium]|nr:response regulator [Symbiobacteriaceae bacterium]